MRFSLVSDNERSSDQKKQDNKSNFLVGKVFVVVVSSGKIEKFNSIMQKFEFIHKIYLFF